jgi:hypothetical protein
MLVDTSKRDRKLCCGELLPVETISKLAGCEQEFAKASAAALMKPDIIMITRLNKHTSATLASRIQTVTHSAYTLSHCPAQHGCKA